MSHPVEESGSDQDELGSSFSVDHENDAVDLLEEAIDDDYDDYDNAEFPDPLADLPDYILHRVDQLKNIHDRKEKVAEEYLKERAALELKYHKLYEPLYKERAAIVKGDRDDTITANCKEQQEQQNDSTIGVNDDGISNTWNGDSDGGGGDGKEKGQAQVAEQNADNSNDKQEERDDDNINNNDNETIASGIPQFWVCSMGHMETIGSLITEEDVDCLEKLEDITCIDDEDGKGFTLRFFFAPNQYFHDTVLTKRYEVPNLLTGDEPILKNVSGCSIQWKPQKSLTFRTIKKKQRGKGRNAGQVRTVTKKERRESFFHWFDPPALPSMEEMDQEEAEQLEELFDHDYDVAQAFRMHIIPKAVLWFTGEGPQQEIDQIIDEH